MMAGAGGAMRATGWRATAIRFQQFGEGGSLLASLAERDARARVDSDEHARSTCGVRDTAPAACAALVSWQMGRGGRRPTSMVCRGARSIGADGCGAGGAMMVPGRRGATNNDTRRHRATSPQVAEDGDR